MDAKLQSVLVFEVAADLPHRELTAATDAALEAARAALPGAVVEASGRLASARGGTRAVRIELSLRAAPAAAMQGERAFADAFVARLAARGFTAARV